MFELINTNKKFNSPYDFIPVLKQSLRFSYKNHTNIKCDGRHEIPFSYPDNNKIINIGEFILAVIVRPDKLYMEMGNDIWRIETASHVSVKAIDSGWDTAVIMYETSNSYEEGVWLNWAYIMWQPGSLYKFKSRASEGNTICSITPKGFIIITDDTAYRFERTLQGMSFDIIKYNGPELSALMFGNGAIGVAVIQQQNHIFLHEVGYDLVPLGPLYECCDNGNYHIERASTNVPIISTLSSEGLLIIYSNTTNFNEKIIITSILPTTHNVSIDMYDKRVSILEYGANFTRKTRINEFGVNRIEELKLLQKGRALAQGVYKRAPGSSFIFANVYSDIKQLDATYLETDRFRILPAFFGGRVAHYIAPAISPQWYFTKFPNGEIAAAPSLTSQSLNFSECTLVQYSEVFALALLVGSPVEGSRINCYTDDLTGKSTVRYAFGQYLGMHGQGMSGTGIIIRHIKEYLKKKNAEENWIFPEIGITCKKGTLCDENHLVSTLMNLFPNVTTILEDVLRPSACTYSDLEWRKSSSEESAATSAAINVYDKLVRGLSDLSKFLGEWNGNE